MAKSITSLLTTLLPNDELWKIRLLTQWPVIIGNNLANRVTLEKIQGELLILGTYDSSWLQELYLLSPIILETINKNLEHPYIKQLRFKQVAKKQRKDCIVSSNYSQRPLKEITLTKKEENALAHIDDTTLRNALKTYLIRCHRER